MTFVFTLSYAISFHASQFFCYVVITYYCLEMVILGDMFSAFCSFGSTSFDIGSDLINSLDFLGYNISKRISGSVFGPLNDLTASANYSFSETDSHDEAPENNEMNQTWGAIGIFLMFLPGIMSSIPFQLGMIYERGYWHALIFFVGGLFYPITLVLNACGSMVLAFFEMKNVFLEWTLTMTGGEAFCESFPQMVLQGYTILYGYEATTVQRVTIVASFVLLARTCIVFGLTMCRERLDFKDSILYTIKVLPTHTTTISFRVLSFSLTIAFLRGWACIPIFGLYMGIMVLTYNRYRNATYDVFLMSMWMLPFCNLGALNAHNLGGTGKDFKEAQTFVRHSSILTFIHHTLVLAFIITLTYIKPEYLNGTQFNNLILKPESQYFFLSFGVTFALGFLSTILSLQTARSVVTAAKTEDD